MSKIFNYLINALIILLLAYLIFGAQFIKWTGADAVFPTPKPLDTPQEVALTLQLRHVASGQRVHFQPESEKIQIVNFWATWCRPCLAEMPALQKLYENEKENIELYLVSLDRHPELVKKFMEKNDYTFPIYHNQTPGPLPPPLNGGGIPKTAVFYDGKMTHLHEGIANWNSRRLRRWIRGKGEGRTQGK